MPVCVLNDVASAHSFLSKSNRFSETERAPWRHWDALIKHTMDQYVGSGEFVGLELSTTILDVMNFYAGQRTPVVDGSVHAAVYAIKLYCLDKLQGHEDVDILFDAVFKLLNQTFPHPADALHVLVQTGDETNGLEVFTPLAFQVWCNDNDLCDNMQYNTAIEFSDFEADLIKRLPDNVRADLYPDARTTTAAPKFTSNFF